MDHDGQEFKILEVPETPDDFYFHVFSISKLNGIGMLDEPFTYNTVRPVDFYCEAAEEIRRYLTVSTESELNNCLSEENLSAYDVV